MWLFTLVDTRELGARAVEGGSTDEKADGGDGSSFRWLIVPGSSTERLRVRVLLSVPLRLPVTATTPDLPRPRTTTRKSRRALLPTLLLPPPRLPLALVFRFRTERSSILALPLPPLPPLPRLLRLVRPFDDFVPYNIHDRRLTPGHPCFVAR